MLHPRSSGTTKRSRTSPLGDSSVEAVSQGNRMASRVVLLILLCAARGINWVLEQPQGSVLEAHPSMQYLFRVVRTFQKSVRMGDFGADSQKSTWLYSGWVTKKLSVNTPIKAQTWTNPPPKEDVLFIDPERP